MDFDRARERRAQKRGGDGVGVTLHSNAAVEVGMNFDLVALDEALTRFAERYPRQAQVVELRFLAGLSVEEAAETLGVSPRTTKLDWQMARAWLGRELSKGDTQH